MLSQHQILARLKVSYRAAHGTLKCFAETGSVASKARSSSAKVTHYWKINTSNFVLSEIEKQLHHRYRI